jgi:hypothetical protein
MSLSVSRETTQRVHALYRAMHELRVQTPDPELRVIGLEVGGSALTPEFETLYNALAHTVLEHTGA